MVFDRAGQLASKAARIVFVVELDVIHRPAGFAQLVGEVAHG